MTVAATLASFPLRLSRWPISPLSRPGKYRFHLISVVQGYPGEQATGQAPAGICIFGGCGVWPFQARYILAGKTPGAKTINIILTTRGPS